VNSSQEILVQALECLEKLSFKLGFIFKGRSHHAVAAALVVLASRKAQVHVTLKKVIKTTKLKGKIINRCLKIIKKAIPETKLLVSQPQNILKHISKRILSED